MRKLFKPLGVVKALTVGLLAAGLAGGALAQDSKVLNVYNWSDYIGPDVIKNFENLPDALATPPLPQRSLILASDGSLLASACRRSRST